MSFLATNLNYVFRFASPSAETYDLVVGPLAHSSLGVLWVFDQRASSLGLEVPGWWWVLVQPASAFAELSALPQCQFVYSVPDGPQAVNIDPGLMNNLELINVFGQIYWGQYARIGVH